MNSLSGRPSSLQREVLVSLTTNKNQKADALIHLHDDDSDTWCCRRYWNKFDLQNMGLGV